MTFGISPFGVWEAQASASALPAQALMARAFDTKTGDYLWLSTGDYARWPRTRQRVFLALTTPKGTLAGLPSFGLNMPYKITDNIQSDMTAAVLDALQPVKEARVTNVVVSVSGQVVSTVVHYVDADTGLAGELGVVYGGG